MDQYPPTDFLVDLDDRTVVHKPTGIRFSFYEYQSEADWQKSTSVIFRADPNFQGEYGQLAAAAKRAAIQQGMKARKPARA